MKLIYKNKTTTNKVLDLIQFMNEKNNKDTLMNYELGAEKIGGVQYELIGLCPRTFREEEHLLFDTLAEVWNYLVEIQANRTNTKVLPRQIKRATNSSTKLSQTTLNNLMAKTGWTII